MRESTISKQGITQSVARSTSAAVTPGPSGRAQDEGHFGLGRGAIMVLVRRLALVEDHARGQLAEVGLVHAQHVHHHLAGDADLLADMVSPASSRRWIMRSWIW
jgi:hypothetical protein